MRVEDEAEPRDGIIQTFATAYLTSVGLTLDSPFTPNIFAQFREVGEYKGRCITEACHGVCIIKLSNIHTVASGFGTRSVGS